MGQSRETTPRPTGGFFRSRASIGLVPLVILTNEILAAEGGQAENFGFFSSYIKGETLENLNFSFPQWMRGGQPDDLVAPLSSKAKPLNYKYFCIST